MEVSQEAESQYLVPRNIKSGASKSSSSYISSKKSPQSSISQNRKATQAELNKLLDKKSYAARKIEHEKKMAEKDRM